MPLFFVDDGTLIGPQHALVLSAIGFINAHGIRVGYRLNPFKSKLLLGRCNSLEEASQHRQGYLDLGFSPSVIPVMFLPLSYAMALMNMLYILSLCELSSCRSFNHCMCLLSTLACSIAILLPHKSLSYISHYSPTTHFCVCYPS